MSKIASFIFLNSNKKIRSAWWVAIFFVILSLFLFPAIMLGDYFGFEIKVWYQVLIILATSLICQVTRGKPLHELVGKIDVNWFRELFIGLMIGTLLMLLPALMLTLFGVIQWQLNEVYFSDFISGISVMISLVLAEELLFRGFIFQSFIDAFGNWPAQIIIAGLFLLTHLNNPFMTGTIKGIASINIFIASMLLGIAYIKTKSLSMPIGIHFMANITQGTILGFGVSGEKGVSLFKPITSNVPDWISGGAFGLEASIVGLIILILLTAFFLICYPSKNSIVTTIKEFN